MDVGSTGEGVRAPVVLVLGGARSGKSQLAEDLAARMVAFSAGKVVDGKTDAGAEDASNVTYVATGEPPVEMDDDPEWAERVEIHRKRRPGTWATVELGDPGELPQTLLRLRGVVVVDALGTWVARASGFEVDTDALCGALVERRASRQGPTVVVSEEVGLGVVPSTALGGAFRDALGDVNSRVAQICDEVLFVVAGRVLPLRTSAEVVTSLAAGADRAEGR